MADSGRQKHQTMKRLLFVLLLAFVAIPVLGQGPNAVVLDRACIGECASQTSWVYHVPEVAGTMRLSIVPSSYTLCPSHRAGLLVRVNGKEVERVVLKPRTQYAITVRGGDEIQIEGRLRLVHAAVRCAQFGAIQYTIALDRMQ